MQGIELQAEKREAGENPTAVWEEHPKSIYRELGVKPHWVPRGVTPPSCSQDAALSLHCCYLLHAVTDTFCVGVTCFP